MNLQTQKRAAAPARASFANSEAVRRVLVLHQLAYHAPSFTRDLQDELKQALLTVLESVRNGELVLDYQPGNEARLILPDINHPHHMQAMVFWCAKLGCTMIELIEAHARLGSGPPLQSVRNVLAKMSVESADTEGPRMTTRELSSTIPMRLG